MPSDRDLSLTGWWARGTVDASQVGAVDERALRPGTITVSAAARADQRRSFATAGYAIRTLPPRAGARVSSEERFHWSYFPLHFGEAGHFLAEEFGARHRFAAVTTGAGMVLTFCGVDQRHPGLEGTLELSADTLFTSARWTYRTPSPSEGAGGELLFVPPGTRDSTGLAELIPARGTFWRRLGGRSRYHQLAYVAQRWRHD